MKHAWATLGITALVLAGSTLLGASPASATDVYRWVDEHGAVHFSDSKPVDDELAITTLELAEFTSDYDPAEDPYSIVNQAARTHERWQAIEAANSERVQQQPAVIAAPGNRSQADTRYRGYGPLIYLPTQSGNQGRDPARLARQQNRALSELELTSARPYSINSGAHRDRVERSQGLPLVTPAPRNR